MNRIICHANSMFQVKPPHVAGRFYSADPKELLHHLQAYLQSVPPLSVTGPADVVLAPHAGYLYSGSVAAYTFQALSRYPYSIIVLLGPSHFMQFNGVAIWDQGDWQTPLGNVPVAVEFAHKLLYASTSQCLPQAFEKEHSLEVQLPFLQLTCPKASIVPILMGEPDFATCSALAQALHHLVGIRKDILILVSSDLSHYRSYDDACRQDAITLRVLQHMDPAALFTGHLDQQIEMCGFVPMTTALLYAHLRGTDSMQLLHYANSGDTAGDKSSVVGYAAAWFQRHENQGLN